MNTYTKQEMYEASEKLPTPIKKALEDLDVSEILKKISTKNNLHVDQLGKLAREVALVIFGLSPLDKFSSNLQASMSIPAEQAAAVAADVNEEILKTLREAIKNATEHPEPVEKQAEPPTESVFEKKISQVFDLSKTEAETATPKPWEQDPYLEKP
jgi:hypothetical protein